jgi:hypothetical protein
MKQESAKPERSLPDLLTGSEYMRSNPDHYRQANLLGLAIAIVVGAERGDVRKNGKKKLLSAFEAECAKVENHRQKENEFYKRHPLHPGHLNPLPDDPLKYGDRIRNWLEKALLLGNIDWDELYNLIGLQIVICKGGRTDWWEAVQSVCKRVKTTTDTNFDPIIEIKTISEKHSKAQEQVKEPAETKQKVKGSILMITARSSQENWEAIRSEYGISKKDFGRKINFVSDQFKRKVIFRDVEHAFVLASQEFSKPAIILAGGVIEELLRLYLDHKNIKVTSDRFTDYIKACEDNGLLKRGVLRLTDSVRDFRNLVHLANEKAKRHTISKATAKGAVSSIFTIANDFQ